MDLGKITYRLDGKQLQLMENGKWMADARVDWVKHSCTQVPHRIDWVRKPVSQYLLILREKRLFLSPYAHGQAQALSADQDIHPLYVSAPQRPVVVTMAKVDSSLINECIERKRALLAAYLELHDSNSPTQPPRILGLRIIGISPFPATWADLQQFQIKKLLQTKDGSTPTNFSMRRLVLGSGI